MGTCGNTPIHLAAREGHQNVVRILMSNMENPNFPRKSDGATPILMAAQNGHKEVVKILMTRISEENSNILSNDGATPILMASQNGHLEIVKQLITGTESNPNVVPPGPKNSIANISYILNYNRYELR